MGWACSRIRDGDEITLRLRKPHLGFYVTRDPDLHVPDPDDTRVVLDLERVGFVWPFGLVFLEWFVSDLIRRGAQEVVVRAPDPDVGNYLVRMRLRAAFEDDDRIRFEVPWDRVRERDLGNRLVELERFRVLNDDAVEELAGRLVRVIRERTALDIEPDHLFLTVGEVISNVEVHSGEKAGTVAAQSYSDSACLAFGDAGVGIPARLESQYPGKADGEIIAHALEPHVTSRHGLGGMGLTELADLVGEGVQRLTINSASGQIVVTDSGTSIREECCPVGGTLVEVELAAGT